MNDFHQPFCRRIIVLAAALLMHPGTLLGQFATEVVASSPTTSPLEAVLGPPGCEDAADFDNVATQPGFVTVAFGGRIPNKPGDDVKVVLTGFQPGQTFVEDLAVLASTDGVSFTTLGSADPNDFDFSPSDVVELGFDLAAGGLESADLVKVENGSVFLGTSSEGPDICGFEAIRVQGPGQRRLIIRGAEPNLDQGTLTITGQGSARAPRSPAWSSCFSRIRGASG